jgi:hypothetical protein
MESCIRDKGKNCAMAEVADKFESDRYQKTCQTRSWTTSKLVLDAQQHMMQYKHAYASVRTQC